MITGVSVPGVDVPDSRGRTGLDRVGRDLTGNPDVVVTDVELLAAAWHVLRRTTLQRRGSDGQWVTEQRETYDRGNGAAVLLYDVERRTVLLTRQFRFPAYVNGHPDGRLVEVAAGLLDADDPETAIRRALAGDPADPESPRHGDAGWTRRLPLVESVPSPASVRAAGALAVRRLREVAGRARRALDEADRARPGS